MSLKAFKKIEVGDKNLSQIQENVRSFLNQFNKTFSSGILIEDVSVTNTPTDIAHGLGRKYRGWVVTDINNDVFVWRHPTSTSDQTKFLTLRSTSDVTISLWVF